MPMQIFPPFPGLTTGTSPVRNVSQTFLWNLPHCSGFETGVSQRGRELFGIANEAINAEENTLDRAYTEY